MRERLNSVADIGFTPAVARRSDARRRAGRPGCGAPISAVDADRAKFTPPVPWRPLLDARGDRTIWPIQFAPAGMNAHINHDLAPAGKLLLTPVVPPPE